MEMLSTVQLQQTIGLNTGQATDAQPLEGGGFAQLLLALFGGNSGGDAADLAGLLLANGGKPPGQEDEETPGEAEPDLYALQMAALQALAPELGAIPLVVPAAMEAAVDSALPTASPLAQGQTQNQLPLSQPRQPAAPGTNPDGPSFELVGQKEAVPALMGQASPFAGGEEFRKAISEVKKALAEQPDKSPVTQVDVEALQHKADHTDLNALSFSQDKAGVKPDDLVNQVKAQILQSRAEGKDEFVVKLKPESLGEITIKMQEHEGKITLSILTASAQTAKLLNESVDALRLSLRPLQAEVREIIPRPEEPAQSQQGSWTGGGFESFQQQYGGRQAHTPQGNSQFGVPLEPEPSDPTAPLMAEDGLNTYI